MGGWAAARHSPSAHPPIRPPPPPHPQPSTPFSRRARMPARGVLFWAGSYAGKPPAPPALGDSIPEIPAIDPPVLPPILDTVVVDTLVVPDTTRDHPDSGG